MVHVPIGKTVIVDLWDTVKRKGIAKYFTDTMDLVQADSEFELLKGDRAIVVQSQEGFIKIVPENEYSKLLLLNGKGIDKLGLIHVIHNRLKEVINTAGGILSIEEIYNVLMQTPLKYQLTIDIIKKIKKERYLPFDVIDEENRMYFALPTKELHDDIQTILNYASNHEFVTLDMIQADTIWSTVRIERILKFLVQTNRCRQDYSYKTGVRYYFIGLT